MFPSVNNVTSLYEQINFFRAGSALTYTTVREDRIDQGSIWRRSIPSKCRVPPLDTGGSFLLIFCGSSALQHDGTREEGSKRAHRSRAPIFCVPFSRQFVPQDCPIGIQSASNHNQCLFVRCVTFDTAPMPFKNLIGTNFRCFDKIRIIWFLFELFESI